MHVQSTWESTLLDWASDPLNTGQANPHAWNNAQSPAAAYEICARLTRANSKTFYMASGLLPRHKRQAVRALYAFCRITDDLVDAPGGSLEARRTALHNWRELALNPHPIPGDDVRTVVAYAWAHTRARYHVPVGYAEQLIDGVSRDLEPQRYASFDELAVYSYGVASTVGLMAMHIIGFTGEEALPYAVKLGVGLQLTNILRDVAEDWRAGRLYLPTDELAAHGLSEAAVERMVQTGGCDARWRAFMRFQIERTRRLLQDGKPGMRLLHRDGRLAIMAAADLYGAILSDIEAHDYNVFNRRAYVSTARKLRLLPGIWWRSLRG